METKLAVKRLTASDLTFFEWHFRNRPAGNQKAINLNADVFIDKLYPALPTVATASGGRLPIDLYLYGPGAAPEANLQRKIIKISTYKNWRLDGEFIADPIEQPERYRGLSPDDLAVIEFRGATRPEAMRIVFLSSSVAEDAPLLRLLTPDSMAAISRDELREAVTQSGVAADHPIQVLLATSDLREAAQSGETALIAAAGRRAVRSITRDELIQAQLNASVIGEEGEALVNDWLTNEQTSRRILKFTWLSRQNAAAAMDFNADYPDNSTGDLEVKTTTGDFSRPFHLSMAELRHAAASSNPYRIYRVYSLTDEGARLRISEPMNALAKRIQDSVRAMPDGIQPDGFVIDPIALEFQAEIALRVQSDQQS